MSEHRNARNTPWPGWLDTRKLAQASGCSTRTIQRWAESLTAGHDVELQCGAVLRPEDLRRNAQGRLLWRKDTVDRVRQCVAALNVVTEQNDDSRDNTT